MALSHGAVGWSAVCDCGIPFHTHLLFATCCIHDWCFQAGLSKVKRYIRRTLVNKKYILIQVIGCFIQVYIIFSITCNNIITDIYLFL